MNKHAGLSVLLGAFLICGFAAEAAAQSSIDLPGRRKGDIPNTPVPPVPEPTCYACPSGYHCSGNRCVADPKPPEPPTQQPG